MYKTFVFLVYILFCARPSSSLQDDANSRTPPPATTVTFERSNPETTEISEGSSSGTYVVEFETMDGQDSSVLSAESYSGDVELIVKMDVRVDDGEGQQPQLVLFLAPEGTTVHDVTTDDERWGSFEENVVSWVQEGTCSEMDHTWFSFHARQGVQSDDEMVGEQLSFGASLKISRSHGKASAYYSLDYDHETGYGLWVQIGTDVPLPSEYESSPLKLGYRIRRGGKSGYFVSTTSRILSVPVDGNANSLPHLRGGR
jgi:hypothetical protein